LNLFLQSTILYAVFTTVVAGDVIWRNSIIDLKPGGVRTGLAAAHERSHATPALASLPHPC
jgi:hypothetical protein